MIMCLAACLLAVIATCLVPCLFSALAVYVKDLCALPVFVCCSEEEKEKERGERGGIRRNVQPAFCMLCLSSIFLSVCEEEREEEVYSMEEGRGEKKCLLLCSLLWEGGSAWEEEKREEEKRERGRLPVEEERRGLFCGGEGCPACLPASPFCLSLLCLVRCVCVSRTQEKKWKKILMHLKKKRKKMKSILSRAAAAAWRERRRTPASCLCSSVCLCFLPLSCSVCVCALLAYDLYMSGGGERRAERRRKEGRRWRLNGNCVRNGVLVCACVATRSATWR